jgi:hypothetical protein
MRVRQGAGESRGWESHEGARVYMMARKGK